MPKSKISDEVLTALVDRVQAGDGEAITQLYVKMRRYAQYWIVRHIGPQDYEDLLHDTFLIVLRAVKAGELRHQRALMSFTRTVVQRGIAQRIGALVKARKEWDIDTCFNYDGSTISSEFHSKQNPEVESYFGEKATIMAEELTKLSVKDQEILRRFYLDGQPWRQICIAMDLTDTTFRLHKSRAKMRLEKLVTKRLGRTAFSQQLAKAA